MYAEKIHASIKNFHMYAKSPLYDYWHIISVIDRRQNSVQIIQDWNMYIPEFEVKTRHLTDGKSKLSCKVKLKVYHNFCSVRSGSTLFAQACLSDYLG